MGRAAEKEQDRQEKAWAEGEPARANATRMEAISWAESEAAAQRRYEELTRSPEAMVDLKDLFV